MKHEGKLGITSWAMVQAIFDNLPSKDPSRKKEAAALVVDLCDFFTGNPCAGSRDEITERAIKLGRPDWARPATDEEVN